MYDKMTDNQPFSPTLYKFGYSKFGRLNAVERMFQWSNFEPLDLLDCIVMTSSVQLTESTDQWTESSRFCAEQLVFHQLYIPHHLRLFDTREHPYIV